jgi:glyoxylase-like metal-dependent hydrolase (beta-lactamase superfamily II)
MQQQSSVSRRRFLAGASCFGAAAVLARAIPLPAWAESVAQDPRVAEAPLLDRGFASVRRIGRGVYGTVADFSKGPQAISNGGFIVGSDAALIIEGHTQPAGAAFELEALRMVSQVPVEGAIDTHYHFDHSFGNAFYGAQGIPVWAHAKAAPLMVERYANVQGQDKAPLFAPFEKSVRDTADPVRRQRAEGDLGAAKLLYGAVDATVLSLPNRPLDPAKLPMTVELGGIKAVIETYPGHTPTDLVVRVPEQNITFTGDLLFNAWYPVTFDAEISKWRATLEKFAGFGKDALFVPGHGQVCGQEGIATLRAVMDDLANQAEKFFKAGVPVAEAVQRYEVPERFKDFPIFAWSFCIGPAIAKFYEEWQRR